MSGPRVRLWAAGLAVVLIVAIAPLWADVATPRPRWTTVQMAAEEVNITLGDESVKVDAVFDMHNTGATATVRMGYPVGILETELKDFAVLVDKKPVANVQTQEGSATPSPRGRGGRGRRTPGVAAEAYRFAGPYKEWKVFDIPFGADQKRTVRVTYSVEPARVTDSEHGPLCAYSYTLRTGATWKGKIAKATIRVKLDGVAPQRLVRVLPSGCQRTNGGSTLTWTMKDFKPTEDIQITYRPSGLAAK